jgi:hypothetical protein
MVDIIAGRFGSKADADLAAEKLHNTASVSEICIFYNSPPGQHGTSMFGDELAVTKQIEQAESAAVSTATIAGVAAGAVVAIVATPVVALAAAGVAAYTGSLAGALSGADESNAVEVGAAVGGTSQYRVPATRRQGGVMLAVNVGDATKTEVIIRLLASAGAVDIERAQGDWHNGDWTDFNPLAIPSFVHV